MAGLDFSQFGQALPLPIAYMEGAEAHRKGVPYDLNPYPAYDMQEPGTYYTGEDREDWSNGWKEAEYAAEYWNNPHEQ